MYGKIQESGVIKVIPFIWSLLPGTSNLFFQFLTSPWSTQQPPRRRVGTSAGLQAFFSLSVALIHSWRPKKADGCYILVYWYGSRYSISWASQVALVVKNPPANAWDVRDEGLIPRSRRSPGEGNDNTLQYSCLESPMDRGAWQATIHRVAKSRTQLKQLSTAQLSISHFHMEMLYIIIIMRRRGWQRMR